MRVTVTIPTEDKLFPLEVSEDLELENFKAFCEVESGIPVKDMILYFDGRQLTGNDEKTKTLKDFGVKDGELVVLERRRRPSTDHAAAPKLPDFSQIRIPGEVLGTQPPSNAAEAAATAATAAAAAPASSPSSSSGAASAASAAAAAVVDGPRQEDDPAWIRDMLRANPDQMAILKQNNPRLADALESGNLEEFAKVLREQQQARSERERQRIRLLTADPFDMEAQRLIAQEIENKNIEHNMELAMEYNPESFGTVVMLYIDCIVNGHHIKAFVDTGAQATIMSQAAAERCNIMRLVDRRWAGIAKGVGIQKIIGRVHLAQIQIGDDFLASSFSILEEQPMDMLLGLDMLKRHQCVIDLKKNVLIIGSTGTETSFLSESELPECARLSGPGSAGASSSSKSVQEDEDKQLAEALARSASEQELQQQQHQDKRLKSSENPSTSTATATSGSPDIRPNDKFTEENVQALIKYGFSREKCIEELRNANGNMTQATAALFAKSLKF